MFKCQIQYFGIELWSEGCTVSITWWFKSELYTEFGHLNGGGGGILKASEKLINFQVILLLL